MKKKIVIRTLVLCLTMVLGMGSTTFASAAVSGTAPGANGKNVNCTVVKADCNKLLQQYLNALLTQNCKWNGTCGGNGSAGTPAAKPQQPGSGNSCTNTPGVCPQQPGAGDSSADTPTVKPQQPGSSASTPTVKPQQSAAAGSYVKQVAEIVNEERSAAGLAPLTLSASLSSVAQAKAEDLRDKNYFSHTSPTYGSPFDMMKQFGISYTAAGENIAKGQRTPESVMSAWMNSSGHRANILNSRYEQIGVGYCTDAKGNTYWVQMFIR